MRKLLFVLGVLLSVSSAAFAQPCTGGATRIGGVTFNDFNQNGIKDAAETKQSNITVNVYDNNNTLVGTDITDANGDWFVNTPMAPSVNVKYRVEFLIPTALTAVGLRPSFNGTGNKSDVQFVSMASCSVDFGVNFVGDYCNANPDLLVACFVSGDPLPAASTIRNEAAIVKIPYNVAAGTTANPTPTAPVYVAETKDVGSVWGSAYQRETKKAFSAAFLKRHVGLGTQGLGGVYVTDMSSATPVSSSYFDLESLGYNLGQSTIASRSLPASGTTSSADPTAFDGVGKIGLGGMDISEDGSILYITDLFNKQLFIVNIGNPAKTTITAADVTAVPIPTPTCTNGVARPFGVSYNKGKVYVGVTCTGENGGTIANVSSSVYVLDPLSNTFNGTPIFTMSMDYVKGAVHTSNNWQPNWNPWVSTFAGLSTNGQISSNPVTTRTGLPQPMFSDIIFTDEGDMVLGFMDRAGHQLGYKQVNTSGTGNHSGYIGGDILRAHFNGSAWILENNGAVGTVTSAGGVGNGEGPGGGEFYNKDDYLTTHEETFMGGMVIVPSTNTVVGTFMDPLTTWSGGFRWLSNTDGSDLKDYQIYATQGAGTNAAATYGKANGLGALKTACAAAPIEIGNYVWIDANKNGIQDPTEVPLPNVTVQLYKTVAGSTSLVAATTTSATGNYYFRDYQEFGVGFDTLTPNAQYHIVLGEGGQWSTATNQLTIGGVAYVLTPQNAAGSNDKNDTDAFIYATASKPFTNYPVDTITIPSAGGGYVNHTLDFGLVVCPNITNPSVAQTICAVTAPTALTVQTNQNAANSIRFVRFSSDQIAAATPTAAELATLYTTGTTIGTVSPTGGASPYTASFTPSATDFPNATSSNVTYYVYAVLNPDLGAACRAVQEIVITVKPTPIITAAPSSQAVCNSSLTTAVALTSTVVGTTYSWANNTTSIGLAANGTSNISAFTATNTGTSPVMATISVVPSANGCSAATSTTFTITANPTPSVAQPSNIVVCADVLTSAVSFTGSAVAGTTYTWTNNTPSIGLVASGTGNIAAFTAQNATSSPIIATITVTPTANGCLGTPRIFTITVNPTPSVTPPSNLIYCNNTAVSAFTFTGSAVAATSYNWTNSNASIGLNASGTNSYPSFTAINATSSSVVANLVVTPSANGCLGSPQNFTITVNPTPSVSPPSNQTVCNGTMTTALTLSGSAVAGTTYSWTNNTPSIGLAASGTGNIASFSATNATANPITATITVTPMANGCAGTARTFTITVNPTPSVSNPADQVICANSSTTAVTFGGSTVTGTIYTWTNNLSSIGLATSGTGNIAAFTAVNGTPSAVIATVMVTPTANGCAGSPENFTITVNPSPTFTVVKTDPTSCGASDGTITLSGLLNNTTYTTSYIFNGATTSNPLTSDGSGAITLGSLSAGHYNNIVVTLGGCTTTPPLSITLTDPSAPTVDAVAALTVCAVGTVPTIVFTGTGSPTFNWTNDNTSIGLGANGIGDIASFVANNVATQQVAHITVTPVNGVCVGTAISFTITVLKPTVTKPVDISVCTGTTINPITFAGSAGASFDWTNNNTATGLTASGTGNIGSFMAANVATTEVSTITVTPSVSGCLGTAETFTLTVAPLPTVTVPANVTVCSGNMTTALNFSGTAGATFEWTNSNTATGLAASGTGNIAAFMSQTVTTTEVSTITVTPTLNGCTGTPQIFTLTIHPKPTASPALQNITICAGGAATIPAFTGTAGATFEWTNDNTVTGLTASGTGNIAPFAAANIASTEVSNIHVRALKDGCYGNQELFTVLTVHPMPTVAAPANITICSGGTVAAITFSGTSGAVFNWTNDNATTGLAASGTGDIAAFVAHATGSAEVSMVIVTPILNGCSGAAQTFTITVNPTPELTTPANTVVCTGSMATVTAFSGTSGAIFNWVNNNTGTGLLASGVGNIAPFMSASTLTKQVSSVTVTPVLNGCVGVDKTFTLTVNPLPVFTISGTSNPTMCSAKDGSMTFSGLLADTTYTVSFKLNGTTTTSTFVSNASGVLLVNGLGAGAYVDVITDLNGCSSLPQTKTLTDPTPPSLSYAPIAKVACGGGVIIGATFVGTPGSSYNWTNDNPAVGLGASGTGNLSAYIAPNVATNQFATIYITPIKNGCIGTTLTTTITVNANPHINPIAPLSYCTTDAVAAINFTSTPAGATYSWTNSNTNTGLAASGTGNIAAFTAAAVTALQRSPIIVTPTLNGCTGYPSLVVLDVNPPVSAGTAVATPPVCLNGSGLPIIDLNSKLTGVSSAGYWADISAVPAGTLFNAADAVLDPNGLPIGTYTFRYTVSGVAPCPNDSEDVTIIIDRCCAPIICIPVSVVRAQ